MLVLDHLAVAASSLEEGREHVESVLGVPLQRGGQHAHFGTQNLLLGLEDGLYLEVIAVDPEAEPPTYPRWFDLDRFTGEPRLQTWIARTDNLYEFVYKFPDSGEPVALSRGDLRWKMAVPLNGILPHDNLFPAVIEWQGTAHPAERLTPSGCSLRRVILSHPQAEVLGQRLAPVLSEERVVFEQGPRAIVAEFDTPNGVRVLT